MGWKNRFFHKSWKILFLSSLTISDGSGVQIWCLKLISYLKKMRFLTFSKIEIGGVCISRENFRIWRRKVIISEGFLWRRRLALNLIINLQMLNIFYYNLIIYNQCEHWRIRALVRVHATIWIIGRRSLLECGSWRRESIFYGTSNY